MAAALEVTIAGLGNMGQAAAERLLDAGRAVAVWNRSPGRDADLLDRGATRLEGPSQAFAAPVCLVVVSDDGASDELVPRILEGARPGAVLVEMSTISVAASRRIAERCAAADVDYLRAPFSGNPNVVRAGKASIFVSGDADVARRIEPLLQDVAPTVRYVGEGERARVFKLVLQILIAGTAELLAEAVVLGESAGIERQALLDVIQDSVVGSRFVASKVPALAHEDWSATFTTQMMEKDIDLVLDLAAQGGAELPVASLLKGLLQDAAGHGLSEKDFMALYVRLKERAKAGGTHG
jgi:3-hydroxyisobutyrate dehydrogenase-like beta-hydroxyacid dehydrogenase